jgi:hypothetical protein
MTDGAGIAEPKRGDSPLKDVVLAMSGSRPKRAEAASTAQRVAAEMAKRREKLVGEPGAVVEAQARALLPRSPLRVPEWDSAGQLFFAYSAMERARPGRAELVPEFRKALAALRSDDWPLVKWAEVDDALDAIRKNHPE